MYKYYSSPNDDGSGCYYRTLEEVKTWYQRWNKDDHSYYGYVLRLSDNTYVGEVSIHFDTSQEKYIVGVVIEAKYRGKGYAKEALCLLAEQAFNKMGLNSIVDNFPSDRVSAEKIFTSVGFVRISDELMELTKERYHTLYSKLS